MEQQCLSLKKIPVWQQVTCHLQASWNRDDLFGTENLKLRQHEPEWQQNLMEISGSLRNINNVARNAVPFPLDWHITMPREEVHREDEFTLGDGLS